ncbi:NUDIX domain-containing protein [Paenibacillus cisolokensis]|mgnify:CR=1 FL=1|jgi:ADP-ribose pyrophosphatase|uniref:DNA mismatch repair protein MutT n=1 Tax=Paenibacillus cisolokensis TaxID=1658519 RepID=A0ABQ4N3R9_9BACL|nr:MULTISPECIES: NUDIX domain-containing protein [Paenibacillus]ALS28672.1 ADP-ribose pyrophosphatase [Paenibacillus sp. 32O-W]GIQ62797.1 DNA mismatch repair protein MutT [Paenibacillus cisolokensis]
MAHPPKHIVSAAAIVLNEENKILLLRGPRRGWEMPGGQVEEGESLCSAVIRETKEETGIDIEIIRFCGIFQNVRDSICNTLFLGRPVGGQFRTSDESLEIGYFTIEEALNMVTWKNFRERIEYCITRQEPFLVEFNA